MNAVDASFAGLNALAATCQQLAAGLPSAPPPAAPTASFQPSAAAVADVHADTCATDTRFAARLHDTGGLLSATAAELHATDETNATRIAAVAD